MTVSEIDITESETVYAVWGYDADGNGTADINDNTHKITVSTGDNGTPQSSIAWIPLPPL